MPCILEPEACIPWADPNLTDPERIAGFLHPAADGVLSMYEVGVRVGNVRNDDPELIEPVDDQAWTLKG